MKREYLLFGFMYPEALLLGMALWGKHKGNLALVDASLVLAMFGGAFALYHSFIRRIPRQLAAGIGRGKFYSAFAPYRTHSEF